MCCEDLPKYSLGKLACGTALQDSTGSRRKWREKSVEGTERRESKQEQGTEAALMDQKKEWP